MITRYAIPFVILAVLFLPLPFVIGFLTFGILLAVRPRGEPDPAAAVVSRFAGPILLRSPPR
ncbi:MAG: hypothetical protein A2W03_03815 [Candidatus Aminicenantes bacterium RBG_16_63_16]|nr:MAG: hypothetical protein A2W03_03815 [Candidatus Aminicenantes bacterium RBG_16_63_16]